VKERLPKKRAPGAAAVMSAEPAAKRARVPTLDTAVSLLTAPGWACPTASLVLADGTHLVSTTQNTLVSLSLSGRLAVIAGDEDEDATLHDGANFKDGRGARARFNIPACMTVDAAGHTGRKAAQTGRAKPRAATGLRAWRWRPTTRSSWRTPGTTRSGSSRPAAPCARSRATGRPALKMEGADARFNHPWGLARDKDGSILEADARNNAVRWATMEWAVSTVAGNLDAAYADGEGAAARFNCPTSVVVDKGGAIVVADRDNDRMRKIAGRQVTTLAGGCARGVHGRRRGGQGELRAASCDGAGRARAPARSRAGRADTLRVVDALLAPPGWMGPVDSAADAAAEAHEEKAQ
jgi:hypothetical protein